MGKKRDKPMVRRWTYDDIPGIVACHRAAYPEYFADDSHDDVRTYTMQFEAFPEGQFLVELDGRVVAYATALIVQLDEGDLVYTYSEITGDSTFSSHDPSGDTLYGADIGVHPDYRGRGLSKLLYQERRKLLKRYNLRRMVAYGRIPGYEAYAGQLTAGEYVEMVTLGTLRDPALNAHMSAGYTVKRVMLDFLADAPGLNYCTWLEMPNLEYKPERRKIAAAPLSRPVRKVRICLAQYAMTAVQSWTELEEKVRFFGQTADTYHCHFLVFPEFFTMQMFSNLPEDEEPAAIMRKLAGFGERYRALFQDMARQYGLHIIGGTHPVVRKDVVYNVAHLFTPTGMVYTQDKLHVTARERAQWSLRNGSRLCVFETPLTRIAIQVGYDIEFPEPTRLLTLAGAEIVFVPFNTDERTAYQRVRYTAQARAVENAIYVAAVGNVGNLPGSRHLLNFGQAAVFTPSDFAFPPSGVAAEAEPNQETVVISELDLNDLLQHRELGSTHPLYDRRPDLYRLDPVHPIRIVRTE